jgi:hypothetical protein
VLDDVTIQSWLVVVVVVVVVVVAQAPMRVAFLDLMYTSPLVASNPKSVGLALPPKTCPANCCTGTVQ